eukprot:13464167-Alexandrium_andersonii.AAC.1
MTTSRRASVRMHPTRDCSPPGGLRRVGLHATVPSPLSAMRTAWLVATSAASLSGPPNSGTRSFADW